MYYEERIVNGVLSWRTTPDGCWTQFTTKGLTNELCHPVRQAAPDLLAALDSCVEIMVRAIGERLPVLRGTYCEEEDWETALRHARAAIAKAKGVQA